MRIASPLIAARLILIIDVCELLPVSVTHDETVGR
jgi:hypothetical protein